MSARRKRRAAPEEHENQERWLVSYADFITLLFAFFTVLYATSQQDAAKEKEFEKSIRKSFAAIAIVGGGSGSGGASGPGSASTPREALAEAMADGFPAPGAGPAEVQDYVERRARKEMGESAYGGAVEGVRHDSLGVRIHLAAATFFPPGSADLKPESYAALEKIGRLLKDSNRRLIVEGHTDDEPIRTARYPSNWELSAARATKIVRYLSQIHGIDGARLAAVAYADKKPIAPNDGEANRARNRRIEIQIVVGERGD